MKCKITVKPVITGPDAFTIETSFESDVLRGVATSVQMDLMDTKERATRAALLALGWRPPAEVVTYATGNPEVNDLPRTGIFLAYEVKDLGEAVMFTIHELDRDPGETRTILKSAIISREPLVLKR